MKLENTSYLSDLTVIKTHTENMLKQYKERDFESLSYVEWQLSAMQTHLTRLKKIIKLQTKNKNAK